MENKCFFQQKYKIWVTNFLFQKKICIFIFLIKRQFCLNSINITSNTHTMKKKRKVHIKITLSVQEGPYRQMKLRHMIKNMSLRKKKFLLKMLLLFRLFGLAKQKRRYRLWLRLPPYYTLANVTTILPTIVIE